MSTQSSDNELAQLRAAITAFEAQRPLLGDPVVDAGLGPLREKLAALEAQAQPAQQRKLATVLFMDIAGHTTLIRDLDPEENMALIDAALARLAEPIGQHGGHVARYQGDGFKAIFGLPEARENDAENAVRAALGIQAITETIAAEWVAGQGLAELRVRVGIDTGLVFAGGSTEGEDTIKGMPINLAARLESAAAPGTILISHNTYRHIRGVFDVQPREPITVKGVQEPVQTYIVLRAKPRTFRMATRGLEGVETRMVGRDHELGMLQDAYADAYDLAETRVVTVVGEAGVGKSRLLYEFDNWLELRPEAVWFFKGRSTPNLRNVPYSLFRDLFAFRFGILDSDSAAVALDKFRAGMAETLGPDLADVVGHWLGFDFSASEAVKPLLGGVDLATLGRAYLTRYFRALAAPTSPTPFPMGEVGRASADDSPVVIFLEDLHWADDASLDLVAYLPEAIHKARLFIVAVTRPSLFERRPGWGEGEAAFRRINLAPLSRRASRGLVNEVLQRVDEVPEELLSLIIDAAEGNPFYVEEMVKMLIDQGVIERIRNEEPAEEKWRIRTDKLAGLRVPPTLTGLLQARLDSLPRPEREALQRASVVGRLFWDEAVAELAQTPVAELRPTLAAVRQRELIFRRERSSFIAAEEYIFKHALLRDVAYETVLLKYRAAFHGRVARWLEEHAGERIGEYLGLIAEHYVQAGEGLRAATLLEQSGHEALQVGASVIARGMLERALALREAGGESDSPAVTAALVGIGRACTSLGDYPAAEAALERGLAGARAAGDRAAEAEALVGLSSLASERGEYDQAWALAEKALPLGQALGGRLLGLTQQRAATVLSDVGSLATAETHALEALTASRNAGDVVGEIKSLNMLGTIAANRRDLDQSSKYYLMCLTLARQANLLNNEVTALINLGNNAYLLGNYTAARAYGRQAWERLQEMGQRPSMALVLGNLAQAELKLGDIPSARRGVREALLLARSLGHQPHVFWLVSLVGQILAATGEKARGLALYGLARAHPALVDIDRVEIDEEVARLDLTAAEVQAGLAAGAALDPETVVDEILAGKW